MKKQITREELITECAMKVLAAEHMTNDNYSRPGESVAQTRVNRAFEAACLLADRLEQAGVLLA